MSSTGTFKSQIFEIFVNSSTEPLFVHGAVISKSEVLKKEVEGLWKEGSEKKIRWPHWSVNAAEKLLEWLYTGDYSCPYPIQAPKVERVLVDEDKAVDTKYEIDDNGGESALPSEDDSMPARLDRGREKTKPSISPQKPLQGLKWTGCRELHQKMTQADEFEKWTGHQLWNSSELDYEATFMTHAELYAMASQYMLDELKNMAWQRLRSVLISIGKPTPMSPILRNFTSLVHFAYQETGETGSGEEDPLRMLLESFAVIHFTSFTGPDFDVLLQPCSGDARDFVRSLMVKTTQQMKHLEQAVESSARQVEESRFNQMKLQSEVNGTKTRNHSLVNEIAKLKADKTEMTIKLEAYEERLFGSAVSSRSRI